MSIVAMQAAEERRLASSRDPGAHIYLRTRGLQGGTPLVLVHGFFHPASAIFDVPGWSLQESLAALGLRVVLFDLRGYGLSSRPQFMDLPPEVSQPTLGCMADAVADLSDVIEDVCRTHACDRVDLLGYSWGTARACAYCLKSPHRVRRLVLYAPVWRPVNGTVAEAAEPGSPKQLNTSLGGYRLFGPGDLALQWSNEIGLQDPDAFRDARALQAADQALIASDAALLGRGYRSPLGPMLDAFAVAQGRPLFDPTGLRGEVLLIRGDHDRLSSEADAAGLFAALGTHERRLVTIGHGTHLLHLEHARTTLIDEVAAFIGATHRSDMQDRIPC